MNYRIYLLRDRASAECYEYFDRNIRPLSKLPNGEVNPRASGLVDNDIDAFRHAYVSGVFTQEYGESVANLLGLWNELTPEAAYSNSVTPGAMNMDLWNNAVGREYGKKSRSREALLKKLHEALKRGELITDPNDKREFKGAKRGPVKASKPVIALDQSESGRNESYLDTKRRLVFARAEFIERIRSGEYPGYTVKTIRGVETPVSKPDGKKGNNIG